MCEFLTKDTVYNSSTISIQSILSYCIENNDNEVNIIVQIILKTVLNLKSKLKLKFWLRVY